MQTNIRDILEEIFVKVIVIPFIPAIVVFAGTCWFVDKYILSDSDRYELGKKW